MVHQLLLSAKSRLRSPYRRLRGRCLRSFLGFGERELLGALAKVGIAAGDRVLVHSSMTGFGGFRGTVPDIVHALKTAITPEGTLLMPTISMVAADIDEHVASGKIFDPRTTPSQVGLITEVFRRLPGVTRSVHPTHAVAAWGADTESWLENHHLADTPCGRGTPYSRLLERNGKILLAGVGISTMTFYHCAEELLEAKMPESPFTTKRYVMRCRVNGQILETAPLRFYDPDLSRRRRLAGLETELRRAGRWRDSRAGTLTLICLNATDVMRTLEDMADRGTFLYVPR